MDQRNDNIVVITKQGDLYELLNSTPVKPQFILRSHHSDTLSGLCLLPSNFNYKQSVTQSTLTQQKQTRLFLTCGRDKTLRVIDCVEKRLVDFKPFSHEPTAIDCSPDGRLIAVGDSRGYLYLLDDQLETIFKQSTKFKDMKMTRSTIKQSYFISEIKFSPNSKLLAIGGAGGPSHIETWEIQEDKLVNNNIISVGFTNSVTHIDWSTDNLFLIATSESKVFSKA
jgi:WD40 repeat protein